MDKLQWHAREYIHTEKSADWYWIVAIIVASVAVISIILSNLIFAILIIVSFFTLSLFASRKPEIILMEINNLGVNVGNTHYPYVHLESFWIETRELYPRLILKSKKTFMPFVVILIEDMEPEKIREFLLKHLPEVEHTEPFLEKLLIYFGF